MKLPTTDFRTLYFFSRICETQSFSEVARQEDVAVSVVSRAIQQLEDDVGQPLFYRNTRAVTPTDIGWQFLEDVKQILIQFAEAQRKLDERKQIPSGYIRLNAPVAFGRLHIAPHLPALAEKYPKLQVILTLSDDYVDPHSEPTDIIFRISTLENSGLHTRNIAKQRHFIVASPTYLAKFGTPATAEDLLQHRCIIYKNNFGADRWLIKQNDQWQQYHIPVALTTNHKEVIQTACIQGLGLALLPDWVVYESLKKGELVRILPQFESSIHEQPRTIAMFYPNMRHHSLTIRKVLDFFTETFGERVYWQK